MRLSISIASSLSGFAALLMVVFCATTTAFAESDASETGVESGERSAEVEDEEAIAAARARNLWAQRLRLGNLDRQRFEVVGVDLSLDGNPDQRRHLDPQGRLVFIERDLNFDGQIDVIEYFAPDGSLVEREFLLDRSDAVTSVQFYNGDRMYRRELIVGREGEPSIELFYGEDGQLVETRRDRAQRGRIDLWEYYSEGRLVRIGYDTTGDGSPDHFEDVR